jgi:circadian clock protein KaiC
MTLIRGEPGVGKTILSMQWLTHGASLGENGVVVTFDQSPKRILADLDGLAFDTAAARVVDSLPRRGSDRR